MSQFEKVEREVFMFIFLSNFHRYLSKDNTEDTTIEYVWDEEKEIFNVTNNSSKYEIGLDSLFDINNDCIVYIQERLNSCSNKDQLSNFMLELVNKISETKALNLQSRNLQIDEYSHIFKLLPNLNWLNLSNNELTCLPDLSKLEKLIELNLSNNKIPSTYKFPKLASLEKLDLVDNKLTSLPDLSELEKLAELDLREIKYLLLISFLN